MLPLFIVTICSYRSLNNHLCLTVRAGAMIACKLAAIEPDRISSLALLNATGGGFECFPKVIINNHETPNDNFAVGVYSVGTPRNKARIWLHCIWIDRVISLPSFSRSNCQSSISIY